MIHLRYIYKYKLQTFVKTDEFLFYDYVLQLIRLNNGQDANGAFAEKTK